MAGVPAKEMVRRRGLRARQHQWDTRAPHVPLDHSEEAGKVELTVEVAWRDGGLRTASNSRLESISSADYDPDRLKVLTQSHRCKESKGN